MNKKRARNIMKEGMSLKPVLAALKDAGVDISEYSKKVNDYENGKGEDTDTFYSREGTAGKILELIDKYL